MNSNKGKDRSSKSSRLFFNATDQIYDEQKIIKTTIKINTREEKNTTIASVSCHGTFFQLEKT